MKLQEVDKTKVTPMMRQYMELKEQNQDLILFFRLGDFYEMFFEDAELVSRELELTLTGKNAGLEERIPMCGIPHHAANLYIEKLIEKGYKVGICEQLEDPKNAKGIVKRGIVQIITSGTVIDTENLNEKENNYIGNIYDFKIAYGISYADITTGEIYVYLTGHQLSSIVSEIVSLGLKEVVVKEEIDPKLIHMLQAQFHVTISVQEEVKTYPEYESLYAGLSDPRLIETVKHLLTYVTETQKQSLSHLQPVIQREKRKYLMMDVHTKRNLELVETLRLHQRSNSLLWLLDRTKTAMGSRRLKQMIESPFIEKEEMVKRYDMIDRLLDQFIAKEDLAHNLYEVYDLERLSGRIAFGNANARDLLQLKSSLAVLPVIQELLKELNYEEEVETLPELFDLLECSIYENPPMTVKEGYLIKEGYSEKLDELKDLRKGGKDFVARFEQEERERTGIKNLRVGYNRVFGYYIEVTKGQVGLVKEEYGYERKQTLTNCERYISPILKEKEALILNAEEEIIELEYQLFTKIRDEVKTYIPRLQQIARIISDVDVLQAFATVAEENHYVRPMLTDQKEIEILENRHPVVEKVLDGEFVANDIIMDENTDIELITGPNMAGKSTYMRELAITVIMAQIGCFVPAKKAVLPIFDAIYTRIGASDDLVSGESTFMVEMKEANHAISHATEKSLILFDELGRGTATYDGMALARAMVEYIHNHIHAKTLFSTHYHELTDLDQTLPHLKNIHVSAYEEDGNLVFLHKVEPGSVDKSYGIHVAKLAHLPDTLIQRATEILNLYETKEKETVVQESLPLEFVVEKESEVEKRLKEIDPLQMTPMEALTILFELKELEKKK